MLQPLRLYTNAPLHSPVWQLAQALNSPSCLVVVRPLAQLPPPRSQGLQRSWHVPPPRLAPAVN